MAYRIGLVEMRNFGPFEDASIDLDYEGVTVIEGQIEGVPGCDSNGAGKSFIFDAVAWCLYGRCIRPDYKGDDVIRLMGSKRAKGGAHVRVSLVGGPESVTVERYRKHSKYRNQLRLIVDGEDVSRGTDAQTELAVERKLGMDFVTFCNSVAFGVREDVKSFFFASDTERKRILDTLLGMELYSAAEVVAKRHVKTIASALTELQTTRDRLDVKRETKAESLESMLTEAELDQLEVDLKKNQLALKKLQSKDKKLRDQIETLQEKHDAVDDELSESKRAFAEAYDEYTSETRSLDRKIAETDTALGFARSKLKHLAEQVDASNRMADTECPTCEQKVPKTHVKRVVKLREGEIEEIEAQIVKHEKELSAANKARDRLVMPEAVDDTPLREVEKEIEAVSSARRELKEKRNGLTSVIEQLEGRVSEAQERSEEVHEEIAKLDEEIAKLDEEIALENVKLARYEFWVSAFGNRGLKSFLIEAEIPEINRFATTYARQLLGHGAVVRLSATSTLKSGASREKLTVTGAIPGYTTSYSGASKGQKKRMDLSLLLAFRRLVASRAVRAIDQVFADEIFDGVDGAGVEQVGELLREEAGKGPVVLVTHEKALKGVGDRIVVVRHTGESASITEYDGNGVPLRRSSDRVSKPKKRPAGTLKRAKRLTKKATRKKVSRRA